MQVVSMKAIRIIPTEKLIFTDEVLGEGGFGVVVKGKCDGIEVAIK